MDWLRQHDLQDKLKSPNLITGDLDSISNDTLIYFNKTEVIETIDQNETDFTKCLRVLEPYISDLSIDHIIAICDCSGRFDQILANINTLYINQQKSSDKSRPLFILSSNNLTWLLNEGVHEIYIPNEVRNLWCSLIPIGHSCTVTTTGLKWNLNNDILKFGDIVSTSNAYDGKSDKVEISTDFPVLWSMGLIKDD